MVVRPLTTVHICQGSHHGQDGRQLVGARLVAPRLTGRCNPVHLIEMVKGLPVATTPEEIDINNANPLRFALQLG